MRKIREILKLMLPAAAIAVTVYFAADAFFMRVQPEPAAPSPTAESAQEEAWTKEEEEQPAEENQDGYACSRLGEEDALLYRELYEAVTGFVPDASLSVQDAERIERVFASPRTPWGRISRTYPFRRSIPSPGSRRRNGFCAWRKKRMPCFRRLRRTWTTTKS